MNLLKRARARIANPENWCQGVSAMDKNGDRVWTRSPDAVKWCALGALAASTDTDAEFRLASTALNAAAMLLCQPNMVALNELTDHETVLKMYDLAGGGP